MFETRGEVHDVVASKLLAAARVVALVTFGLLPIFFIPYVPEAPLNYTKILVAALGTLLALILFAFATLRQGTLAYRIEVPLIALWAAAAVALLSALLSGDFYDAFWGTEVGPHAAVFIGLLALATTLFAYIGRNKEMIVRLYVVLLGGAFLLAVFHIIRLFLGPESLTFGLFSGNATLSPFSEWNSLAIFFGLIVILSLVALEQLSLHATGKILFAVGAGLSLLMLGVINFAAVFVVLGIVALVMVIYALTRGRFRGGSSSARIASQVSIGMSIATLIFAVVFVIGGSTIGAWVSQMTSISYVEVRPSLAATLSIAKQTYGENLFLGVGTNRFSDAWRLYRDPAINETIFWKTDFQSGYGYIPTLFVTQGMLGAAAWLAFLLSFLFIGLRTLTRAQDSDRVWYFIALSSFVASAYLWGMSFLYVPSPVLLLLAALTTGVFLAARRTLAPLGERTAELLKNPRVAFMTVAVTVLVVVFSVGAMYYLGRHYIGTYVYRAALVSVLEGGDPEVAAQGIARAFSFVEDDLYARQIASYERERMIALMSSEEATEEVQARFQQSLQTGIQAGMLATTLDSTDPETWATLGRVYATVIPLKIEGALERAKEAFERALALDPKNPGRILLLAEVDLLGGDKASARTRIAEAVALKSNYTDALFLLAQLEIEEGNVQAAIDSTRATTLLDPENPVRYFQLGVLEFSAKKNPDAIRSLERAVALSPDYSNARYFLAFAYDQAGRRDDARTQLEEVLTQNAGNAEVEALLARLNAGQSISAEASGTQPIPEENQNGGAVTAEQVPDSSLLTPVNTDTVPAGAE